MFNNGFLKCKRQKQQQAENSQEHEWTQTRKGQRCDVMNIVVLQNPSGKK